jgi:hypothetical protein
MDREAVKSVLSGQEIELRSWACLMPGSADRVRGLLHLFPKQEPLYALICTIRDQERSRRHLPLKCHSAGAR